MIYQENELNTILIVDDEPNNLKVLHNLLIENDYIVRAARNGAAAIESAQLDPPDLILLDIKMPNMDGYEVCLRLKSDSQTEGIPIIFISALNQVEDIISAFNVGGVDYITKPFQFEEVVARVQTHLTIIRQQQKLLWQSEQLEKMVQRDRERFEQITNMREKFVRGHAHDLKNPLTLIGGYASMMLRMDQVRQSPELKEMAQEIEGAGADMLEMIGNMLDVLRFQTSIIIDTGRIDLNMIVDDVVSSYLPLAAAKNIKLEYKTRFSEVPINADTKLIQRAVENLVSNAVKYSPNGSDIVVMTDCEDDKAILQVKDNGYGIPEYDLPLLFDPFYRSDSTSEKAEGTGLGLSVTKEIVEQHGGRITVESLEGQGSSFTVILNCE